jgi:hypothetical protein
MANAFDSGATRIQLGSNAGDRALTIVDMAEACSAANWRYHVIAASTKKRGEGIGRNPWERLLELAL